MVTCSPGTQIPGSHLNGASRDVPYELLLLGRGSFWAFLFAVIQMLLPFPPDLIG